MTQSISGRDHHVRIIVDRLASPAEAKAIAQKIITEADRVIYNPPRRTK